MKSTFLLFAAVICLVACNRHPPDPTRKPGDADYPAETPNPSHLIALIVSSLQLSNYQFDAGYQSDEKLCNQQVGLGVYVPLYLAIPIDMTKGEVCLPFRCGVGTSVMKNCEPLVFGPLLAIARRPGWLKVRVGLNSSLKS